MTSNRRLVLSPRAEVDLRDLLHYTLQTWGVDQHDAYAGDMTDAFDKILQFPAMGRRRDDLRSGARSYRVKQHRILYLPDEELVMVLRIVHVRRDVVRLEE